MSSTLLKMKKFVAVGGAKSIGEVTPPNIYHYQFLNWDGTVLQEGDIEEYFTPRYIEPTPRRQEDAQYYYTFSGWDTEPTPIHSNVTYTAQYSTTLRSYPIYFEDWDGSVLQIVMGEYGRTPEYWGETPTRAPEGGYRYTFSGRSPAISTVTGPAVYTAQYTSELYIVKARFYDAYGYLMEEQDVYVGDAPTAPSTTPVRSPDSNYYYEFNNWSPHIGPIYNDTNFIPIFIGYNRRDVLYSSPFGTIMRDLYYNTILLQDDRGNSCEIEDRNVGAGTIYTSQNWNWTNDGTDTTAGHFYAWGNNYGFTYQSTSGSISTAQVNASSYGPDRPYTNSMWRRVGENNWDSSNNRNLWGEIDTSMERRRGPCRAGFHVPFAEERSYLLDLYKYITAVSDFKNNTLAINEFRQRLLIPPMTGQRSGNNIVGGSTSTLLWTDTTLSTDVTKALRLFVNDNDDVSVNYTKGSGKQIGHCIRAFKSVSPTLQYLQDGYLYEQVTKLNMDPIVLYNAYGYIFDGKTGLDGDSIYYDLQTKRWVYVAPPAPVMPGRTTVSGDILYFKSNSLVPTEGSAMHDIALTATGTEESFSRLFTNTGYVEFQGSVTALDNVNFVSCWFMVETPPTQNSNQVQPTPYCTRGGVILDWQHKTSGKYDCFEYCINGTWPRGAVLGMQKDVWYHVAYGYDGTGLFYEIRGGSFTGQRTYLTTGAFSTESKRQYIRNNGGCSIHVGDALLSSVTRTTQEINDYFEANKSFYGY